MKSNPMRIVFCGLSVTSSWGNAHADTYRALIKELCLLGHDVCFLECDKPWYAANRDFPALPFGRLGIYGDLVEFKDRFREKIEKADAVIVGSYVSEGAELGKWILRTARGLRVFYDLDTPITLDKLERGEHHYLSPELLAGYDLYLSFSGGPILEFIAQKYGCPCVRPLHCSVDVETYYHDPHPTRWDLGYFGAYGSDRQPLLNELLINPSGDWHAGRFVVAGSQYPAELHWNANINRIEHLPPGEHRRFYNSQRFSLNLTRKKMAQAGYSPGARLFEAAACGAAVISDYWPGIDSFFEPGNEILIAQTSRAMLDHLRMIPDKKRLRIGQRARERVLRDHSSARRAMELESYLRHAMDLKSNGRLYQRNHRRTQREHRSAG